MGAFAAKVGDPFPALGDFKLEGSIPNVTGKVLLVDFWASWCAPCKKAFPTLKEMHEKFSSRGALVVAVSVDEEKSEMEGFLKKNPVPFAVVRDPASALAEKLSVEVMPTSFVVGANGRIAAVHSGFHGDATRKQYIEELEAALVAAR